MTRTEYIRLTAVIATILFVAVVAVCIFDFFSVARRAEVSPPVADSVAQDMQGWDSLQMQVVANEIRKARQHKERKPKRYKLQEGQVSPYDSLFRHYAKAVDWDWTLVAAVAYVESKFHHDISSKSGAKGLMQLMPRTAAHYGCPDSLLFDPEENIKAGTALLADLERRLRRKNIDHDLVYFTLAGFHAGLGHIFDAITMADSLGYNPTLWHDNVEICLQLKADPDYYSLPYVRLGRFNGKVTSAYIREVLSYQVAFKKATDTAKK